MKLQNKTKESQKNKQPQIRFLNNALFIDNNILVFGDFHIGFEEHIAGNGILPNIQLKEIFNDLESIFGLLKGEKIKIKKIVILGDLKHEFGGISYAEWRETIKLLDFLIEKCKDIVLIKGNHDNILGPIARKKQIKLKNFYKYKKIVFMHGHKEFKSELKKSRILILGHLHPAISLKDKYKKEKYKCFLVGKWREKQVYVLPSFSEISFGYDLRSVPDKNADGFLFIRTKELKKFNVIVYNSKDKKEYGFGKLKDLIKERADLFKK